MAFQKSHTKAQVTHTSAYHRIIELSIDYEQKIASILVLIYTNSTARNNESNSCIDCKTYTVDNESGTNFTDYYQMSAVDPLNQNHIERSYEYLKTLSDYSDATDV